MGDARPGVTGIVLAGGRSTRFGSDKLVAEVEGMPLLHHAVLAAAAVSAETVVVVAPDGPDPSLPRGVPARIARDLVEGEGPLHGAAVGLGATRSDLAVIVAGDMPSLSIGVLAELVRVAREAPVDGAVLADLGAREGWRPLPAVVAVGVAEPIARALLHDGERSLIRMLQALRLAVVDEPTWHALDPRRATFADVDEPSDLPRSPGTTTVER